MTEARLRSDRDPALERGIPCLTCGTHYLPIWYGDYDSAIKDMDITGEMSRWYYFCSEECDTLHRLTKDLQQ